MNWFGSNDGKLRAHCRASKTLRVHPNKYTSQPSGESLGPMQSQYHYQDRRTRDRNFLLAQDIGQAKRLGTKVDLGT
jgi:hypothetical protein